MLQSSLAIAIALLARLTFRESFLLLVTFAIAAVNWLIVRKSNQVSDPAPAPTPK